MEIKVDLHSGDIRLNYHLLYPLVEDVLVFLFAQNNPPSIPSFIQVRHRNTRFLTPLPSPLLLITARQIAARSGTGLSGGS